MTGLVGMAILLLAAATVAGCRYFLHREIYTCGETSILSEQERNGEDIFFGDGHCF